MMGYILYMGYIYTEIYIYTYIHMGYIYIHIYIYTDNMVINLNVGILSTGPQDFTLCFFFKGLRHDSRFREPSGDDQHGHGKCTHF